MFVFFQSTTWTPNHCDAVDAIVRPSVRARSLHVYRLYAPSSVEERILDVQRAKTAVARAVVNDENSAMVKLGTDRVIDLVGDGFAAGDASSSSGLKQQQQQQQQQQGGAPDATDVQYRDLDIHHFVQRTKALDVAAVAAAATEE